MLCFLVAIRKCHSVYVFQNKRLVISISNLAYVKEKYLDNLLEQFKGLSFPHVDSTREVDFKDFCNTTVLA